MEHQERRHSADNQTPISSLANGRSPLDTFGIVIFFIVVLEIVLLFLLNAFERSRINSLETKLAEHQQTLNLPENASLNRQINEVLAGNKLLDTVLSSKARWSKFYVLLNEVTPKNVKLTSVAVSQTGTYKADGYTPSLSSLAQALVAWREGTAATQTPFSSITLNSNSFADVDGKRVVTFSVSGQIELGKLR